jgi:hypothetical protein
MVKLKTKVSMDGAICFNASQKSAVLLMVVVDGILISITNKVNAIANTPSQKVSNRELGFDSGITFLTKVVLFKMSFESSVIKVADAKNANV